MFREFQIQLTVLLALTGAETFRRKEMVIRKSDVQTALKRRYPTKRFVVQDKPCILTKEKQEMYQILFQSFGPGINMTKDAYNLLHSVVFGWHRSNHERNRIQSG